MTLPVTMRSAPSVTFGSTTNNVHTFGAGDASYPTNTAFMVTTDSVKMYFQDGPTRTVGTFAALNSGSPVSANAEL